MRSCRHSQNIARLPEFRPVCCNYYRRHSGIYSEDVQLGEVDIPRLLISEWNSSKSNLHRLCTFYCIVQTNIDAVF